MNSLLLIHNIYILKHNSNIHLIPPRPLLTIRFSAFCHLTSAKLETAHPVTSSVVVRLFIASYNCVEMAKNVNAVNCINWEHSENFLRRSDGLKLSHPSSLLTWVDDMKKWPELSYGDIFNYFVLSEGVDGAAMKHFKSTEAYQYLHSGKVDRVMLHSEGDFVFLKANVHPSQSSSPTHSAWVLISKQGSVETTGCSCIADLGRSCSHAASILWKVKLSHTSSLLFIIHDNVFQWLCC